MKGRGVLATAVAAAALALPSAAAAAPEPLGHTCADQNGVRFCTGDPVKTFDGVPLDVDVTLPPTGDGPFPTIAMLHGWGGSKANFEASDASQDEGYNNVAFAKQGYAVINYSARGWGNSCGAPPSRTPDCQQQLQNGGDQSATGWIHLKDRRREAHDTQFLLGTLVDQGIADPNALGATGVSYGGGESIELAYLNDKTQMPNGEFVPWTSPDKKLPLKLAAAWPRWPWSDLVSSLLPNGRFLDYKPETADDSRTPIGIPIQTYVSGLYALGNALGWVAPAGLDPNADLTTWFARVNAGEPTDDDQTKQIADEIYDFHQGFGCSGCGATPAPMLLQSGWTDDLFPPRESLRVYTSLRAANPRADVTLQLGDLGHDRGQNKPEVDQFFNNQGLAFFDKHLKGSGNAPVPGSVTAFTQTCPSDARAGGPFSAASWPELHPGAVVFGSKDAQTVTSAGGNPTTGQTLDPLTGGGACATVADAKDPGVAYYEGTASGGYTLLGLPVVRAKVELTGDYGQLDSRLWDVAPDGTRTLVSRGAYRLQSEQSGQTVEFQLSGNGWRFAAGHKPQLELLGRDAPYLRPSNTEFTVTVSNVAVVLPTLERPGIGPVVTTPIGDARTPKGKKPRLKLRAKPRRVRAGARRRVTFRVSIGKKRKPVRGARVRFAGKRHRTNVKGRVRFKVRFAHRGKRRAVATRKGFRRGATRVRVIRSKRR